MSVDFKKTFIFLRDLFNKRKSISTPSFVFRAFISLAFLGGLLYSVPLDDIFKSIKNMDATYFFVAAIAVVISLLLRSVRWLILFPPLTQISLWSCFKINTLGLALNGLIPGRLGDFLRIGMATQKTELPYTVVISTVVIERLFDAFTLLLVIGSTSFLISDFRPSEEILVMNFTFHASDIFPLLSKLTYILVGCTALGFLLIHTKFQNLLLSLASRIKYRREKTLNFLNNFFRNLESLKPTLFHKYNLLRILIYSFLTWGLIALCNYTISFGLPDFQITFAQALVMTALSTLAAFIPSVPGAWGVYESASLFALIAMGVDATHAQMLGYSILCHLCQYSTIIISGAFSVLTGTSTESFANIEE